MREKMFAIGDDFWIEDGNGERAVRVDGKALVFVSKRWFRVRDTYGIEIALGQDDALVLAVTVCVDQMSRA
jgi:uncharacterized protein YxjI